MTVTVKITPYNVYTYLLSRCSLKLQQHGGTEVCSTSKLANGTDMDDSICAYKICLCTGKWNNLFTATLKVTNTAGKNVAVTDVYGKYLNNGNTIP